MILNLTQHTATHEQIAHGVVDLPAEARERLTVLLTVNTLPTWHEIIERCENIAELACQNGLGGDEGDDPHPTHAMIGGAPAMMGPLEAALRAVGIKPLYAFSTRESVETVQADGSVRKTAVFRHVGWWPASE
jgi:hypothetical protein